MDPITIMAKTQTSDLDASDRRYTRTPKDYPGIKDAPPTEYALLPKGQLRIDDRYQRNLRPQNAREIAAEWSWVACGALKVSLRPDGEWYVFDGQHRLAAAMLRSDIVTLPCIIYEHESVQDEARGFLTGNTQRPMLSSHRFKAQVVAGDAHATVVQDIVQKAGWVVGNGVKPGGNRVSAIGELTSCVRENEQVLRRIFPVMANYVQNAGGVMNVRFIRACFYVECALKASGTDESLALYHRRKQLEGIPWERFVRNFTSVNLAKGRTGVAPRAVARAFLSAFNHGRRNKLVISGLNDDE